MKVRKKLFVVVGLLFAIILVATALLFMPRKNAHRSFAAETLRTSELGKGIDVVGAERINAFKTTGVVFDYDKVHALTVRTDIINETAILSQSTTDINELVSHYQLDSSASVGLKATIGSLSMGLSGSTSFDYEQYCFKYYYTLQHSFKNYQVYIKGYNNASTFASCFSEEYLNDLQNVKNGSIQYVDFFKKYGTHIVGKAVYGGALNATYSIASDEVILNQDTMLAFNANISAQTLSDSIGGQVLTSLNAKYGKSYAVSDIKTNFYVYALGGNTFPAATLNQFYSGYQSWTQSFAKDKSNSVVIEYGDDGLIPLYKILPQEYNSMAGEMEEAFKAYCKEGQGKLINKFKTDDYKHFSGGTGTAEKPYLIESVAHLRNIERDMSAHYALINDIDIKGIEWTPLGGEYKDQKPFTGSLDGKGYSIIGLKKTGTVTEKGNRYYFGLFGKIGKGGVVKNLNFANVNVNLTKASGNASNRIFFGTVAGIVCGEVNNVSVVSGTYSFNHCVKGSSFVGGIAGFGREATFTDCKNGATLFSGRYSAYTGGISAYARGCTFNNCTNYGSLMAKCTGFSGNGYSGGMVGMAPSKTSNVFNGCSNKGSLSYVTYKNIHMGWNPKHGDECAYPKGPNLTDGE